MSRSVLRSPKQIEVAQQRLRQLTVDFEVHQQPGQTDKLQPEEWAGHLLGHPLYARRSMRYFGAAQIFAESRESTDGLSPDLQALAGSLIAVTFDQEQLLKTANA